MNARLSNQLLAVLGFTFFAGLQCMAAEIAWTSANSGNWSTAANWSPNQVPGGSDNVFITNNGTYTVTIDANASVNTLTAGGSSGTQTLSLSSGTFTINGATTVGTNASLALSGGTLAGVGDVTVTGTLSWTGGTMSGSGKTIIANTGTLSLSS